MHLRPLVLATAFVTSALAGCSRDEFAPWGFAEDVRLECSAPSRGQVGVPYSYTPTVVTGVPDFTFALDPATPLPPGLTLDPATGTISGTPSAEGTYPLTLRVTDGRDATSTVTCGDIIIDPGAGIDCREEDQNPDDVPDAFTGLEYVYEVTAAGGRPPYSMWSDNGTLPPGLAIEVVNDNTARIIGTPTTPGVYNVTLTAVDNDGVELASECGVLEVRDPIQIDTDALLGVFPDGCVSFGTNLDDLIADGVVVPMAGAPDPTCALLPGRGNGSRNFDADPMTPDTMPPGIAVNATSCELTGTIDSKLRFGAYAWITTVDQVAPTYSIPTSSKGWLPYCAPQSVQAGTAYGVQRQDTGVENTLAPGHLVFDYAAAVPPTFVFGDMTPDPLVTVTYTENCAGACFYAYTFSYNALSGTAQVSANPSSKFPQNGFEGFTHAIRVTENDEPFLRNYSKRAFVSNLSFDYCIAQNEQDCGNAETDPEAKKALIQANGDGSNYEFGLVVLPKN